MVAVSQHGEQRLHLLAALLDVADVIDDQSRVAGKSFQRPIQFELGFGAQELLDEHVTGSKQDTAVLVHQLLSKSTQQMAFAATRIPEHQDLLMAIQEAALQQYAQLRIGARR